MSDLRGELTGLGRPLFQREWWLEAASNGRIERVEVFWDAVCVGSLSFIANTRLGFLRSLGMPPYTRTLGPILKLPEAKPARHALNVQRVVRSLWEKLPTHDRFQQLLDPDSEAALAFSLAGPAVGTVFTFRAYPGQDGPALLANVEPHTRRLIKSAARELRLIEHQDVERFLRVMDRGIASAENTNDVAALRRIFAACFARCCGTFLAAVDSAGVDLACVFLAWDDSVAYYLVPTRDRERSGGSANAFLVWSSLTFALRKGLAFDLDGYNSHGTARFMSSFGLPPIGRPSVLYVSPRARAFDLAKLLIPRKASELPQDMYNQLSLRNIRLSRRQIDGPRRID